MLPLALSAIFSSTSCPGRSFYLPVPGQPRLSGLLEMMKQAQLDDRAMERFYVVGGECNYMFRCTPGTDTIVAPIPRSPTHLCITQRSYKYAVSRLPETDKRGTTLALKTIWGFGQVCKSLTLLVAKFKTFLLTWWASEIFGRSDCTLICYERKWNGF